MLITLSGPVGSGKTTAAHLVLTLLSDAGFAPRRLRFRYLGLLGFRDPRGPQPGPANDSVTPNVRHRGFRLRRLTATRAAAYAVRILAFRFSGIGASAECDILDRYFYDSLAQYALSARTERVYARALRRLMPVPDLAIVLVAANETIAARRRNYAPEYVEVIGHQYRDLAKFFPNVKCIPTDPGSPAADEIRQLVEALIDRLQTARPSAKKQ